jgi:hypothetical protein
VTDKVSHPYKTTGRITVFAYFNFYISKQQAGRPPLLMHGDI